MTAEAHTFLSLMKLAASETREGFQGAAPGHVLVIGDDATQESGATSFKTAVGRGGGGLMPGDPTILPVKKREGGNAFTSMITVGRAPNNDVVLHDPSVSKFHAYFTQREGGLHVIDAGATNFTKLNGAQLAPNKPSAALGSGDLLDFGDVRARFLDARGLFDYLRAGLLE
ncbi:MAG: FHA domain-containing protein [Planctomycetota bacterium]